MGKYDEFDGQNCTQIQAYQMRMLNHIANELAEANRLKRVDLRIKCQGFSCPQELEQVGILKIKLSELSDQA